MIMNRKAVIDIGTNSIKFYVAELESDGSITTILDQNNIVRLGEGLKETGELSGEAMKRNSAAIAEFVTIANQNGVDDIIAVGTMALRNAKNSAYFLKMVKAESGVDIKVLPGEEEARLSYLAVVSGLKLGHGEVVIFDTGGGSTEFIFGKGEQVKRRFSINLGSVRITEDIFKSNPVTEAELKRALEEISKLLAENDIAGSPEELIGMGGTVTSIGAVKHKMVQYDPDVIQGSKLELTEVNEQIEMYRSRTLEERAKIVGLQPKRADVILAGTCILQVIMEKLNVGSLTISDRGLRHGLMYDRYKQS
jgi:exopolyphosphatase/guanosine-5'-triphosphate,3'-diphosphate pyrophosphatase